MCTFRASCYSTRLSWAHTPVINWAVCLVVVTLLKAGEREEEGRKEGNVLFNDTLNTFYLRLFGIGTYGKGPFR